MCILANSIFQLDLAYASILHHNDQLVITKQIELLSRMFHMYSVVFHWYSSLVSNNSSISLHCRHNDHDGVSNHQPHGCLLNRLFGRRSKKTSKLRVTGLCAGKTPGTGEFPAQRVSNAEMFPFDDVIMYLPICWQPVSNHSPGHRDKQAKWHKWTGLSVYAPSQWETTLHCNVVSRWLGTDTKWSLNWTV